MLIAKHPQLRHLTGWAVHYLAKALPTRLVVYTDTQTAPVYVSEEVQSTKSADFADLDFSTLGQVARTAKLWVQVFQKDEEWQLVYSTEYNLDHVLVCDGDAAIEKEVHRETKAHRKAHHKLLQDTHDPAHPFVVQPVVLCRCEDTLLWLPRSGKSRHEGRKPSQGSISSKPTSALAARPISTASYDMLVKIYTLQKCLDDARIASRTIAKEIAQDLPCSAAPLETQRQELNYSIAKTRKFIHQTQQSAARIRERSRNLQRSTENKASELSQWESTLVPDAKEADAPLPKEISRSSADAAEENITKLVEKEQARLASQLLAIFPIDPVEPSFHFTICELPMPSVFTINHYDPVQVGAALGLVAQVVVLLSRYLDVALPYPIRPYGSQSFVVDHISRLQGSRMFPLWTKGALLYRVEYALYLLHKDIEKLMEARKLAVVDLKQTLANLKNLLLVVSSS